MRYFVELSYLGTNYNGWQRQTGVPSIQQTLEEALSRLMGEQIAVTGAGRTDAGVHAAYYVAHFDTEADIAGAGDARDFIYHANSILPSDIALKNITRVPDDAHARYDATEREYAYRILPFKDPFRTDTSWQYTVPLDSEAMNEAAVHLLGVGDFTSFAKLGSNNKTNICRVFVSRWRRTPEGELVFTIRADRFLRNMVRAIVGTSVDVGRGKITPERFGEIVAARDLRLASGGAPAAGLFLTDIEYSNLNLNLNLNLKL